MKKYKKEGTDRKRNILFHNSRRFATRVVQHSPLSTDMRLLNCTFIIPRYTCSTIYLPFKRVVKETVSVV